jgi:hypothetical protein
MSEQLARLANRLAGDPDFIAGHVSTSALVAALSVDEPTAVKLRLCRYPRGAGDVRLIAERFGLDIDALAAALASNAAADAWGNTEPPRPGDE